MPSDKLIRTPLGPFTIPGALLSDRDKEAQYCYTQLGLKYNPDLKGEITVKLSLRTDGAVRGGGGHQAELAGDQRGRGRVVRARAGARLDVRIERSVDRRRGQEPDVQLRALTRARARHGAKHNACCDRKAF